MKHPIWLLLPGIGTILLGLPYAISLFGPTEAEIRLWRLVSLCTGIVSLLLVGTLIEQTSKAARFTLSASSLFIAALNIPPLLLWWQFHGRGISDGTPPSRFIAHWAFSLPHIVLLGLCLWAALLPLLDPQPDAAKAHGE
jgi:hypothetical protein